MRTEERLTQQWSFQGGPGLSRWWAVAPGPRLGKKAVFQHQILTDRASDLQKLLKSLLDSAQGWNENHTIRVHEWEIYKPQKGCTNITFSCCSRERCTSKIKSVLRDGYLQHLPRNIPWKPQPWPSRAFSILDTEDHRYSLALIKLILRPKLTQSLEGALKHWSSSYRFLLLLFLFLLPLAIVFPYPLFMLF